MRRGFVWHRPRWSRSTWWAAVSAALCAGCGQGLQTGVPLSSVVGSIKPLAGLRGVKLGASAENVRSLRPNAVPSPYVGLAESIEGDSVFYRFSGSAVFTDSYLAGDDVPVRPNAALTVVEAWIRPGPIDSISFAKWLDLKAELVKLHGGELECFLIQRPHIATWGVSWGGTTHDLTLFFRGRWVSSSALSGTIEYPSLVRLVISSHSAPLPEMASKASASCPASWSAAAQGRPSTPPG